MTPEKLEEVAGEDARQKRGRKQLRKERRILRWERRS
jgi:hypothetical protein